MKRLVESVIILSLLIGISSADYTKDLEDTLLKQEKIIDWQAKKLNKFEAKEASEYLFRIPLTSLGIKTSFARGFCVGGVTVLILL